MTEMLAEETLVKLSNATLDRLPANVRRPGYDRAKTRQGIMHIGVGGFHRAHQAVYMDEVLAAAGGGDWAICGVGLLPGDSLMRDALKGQDGLYTLVERGTGSAPTARVIGSMTDYLFAPDDPEAVLVRMASPDIRIVSLTITEGGYYLDSATGSSDLTHPDLVHDMTGPARPATAFGYIVEALDRRRRAGVPPFTVQSCDNVQSNGDVTKFLVLALAEKRDPALHAWIVANGAFPNSMVDRITPATTDADRQMLRDSFGVDDAWPVMTEPFIQWVIEDHYCDGRPPLETVGAQMTDDVEPYELMKLRLLNASHSSMAYLAVLDGFTYVHDVMADPLFRDFIVKLMDIDVTPVMPPIPDVDLGAYKASLVERFSNPAIGDQVLRLCQDGSSKFPKFLLPTLRAQLAQGRPIQRFCLVIASWCRAMTGTDEQGREISFYDPMAEKVAELARATGRDPQPFMKALKQVFGEDLPVNDAVVAEVRKALESLYDRGARATLADYV